LVSTQHEKGCGSDVVAPVFIMISTSIAEELRILDFDNLFQQWLSVKYKGYCHLIISRYAHGTTVINRNDLQALDKLFCALPSINQ